MPPKPTDDGSQLCLCEVPSPGSHLRLLSEEVWMTQGEHAGQASEPSREARCVSFTDPREISPS